MIGSEKNLNNLLLYGQQLPICWCWLSLK